jgi:hypothetical protein
MTYERTIDFQGCSVRAGWSLAHTLHRHYDVCSWGGVVKQSSLIKSRLHSFDLLRTLNNQLTCDISSENVNLVLSSLGFFPLSLFQVLMALPCTATVTFMTVCNHRCSGKCWRPQTGHISSVTFLIIRVYNYSCSGKCWRPQAGHTSSITFLIIRVYNYRCSGKCLA